MYLCTRKKLLHFGSHPLADPEPGILGRILQHWKIEHFSTISLIYLEKLIADLHENFATNVTSDKKVPLKFGNSSGCAVRVSILLTPDREQIRLGGGLCSSSALVYYCIHSHTHSLPPRMQRGSVFSLISLSVCLFVCLSVMF